MEINKLPSKESDLYYGWHPFADTLAEKQNGDSQSLSYDSWDDFFHEWGNSDIDYNFVIDFYFSNDEHLPFTSLCIWLGHARKAHTRGILIRKIEESDLEGIKAYLAQSLRRFEKRFSWVKEK